MQPLRMVACTEEGIAVVNLDGERATARHILEQPGVQCVAVDPFDPGRIFAGTFDHGVRRSRDHGESWSTAGDLPHRRVMAMAFSRCHRVGGSVVVYAGTEPSNLYRSDDDGATWIPLPGLLDVPSAPSWSFPPRPQTSHVRTITLHPEDPDVLFAGIELGGVMRSTDGGVTWDDRKPGSYADSHAIATHPAAPGRVYEAAGGGVALSDDGGESWRAVDDGLDQRYVWGLAVDPEEPDLWYVSAARGAMEAHGRGPARAGIYRKRGTRPWERLGGTDGLERSLTHMPYALLTHEGFPRVLVAGLRNGELLVTRDAGDSWTRLDVRLPGIIALAS
ncbi:glycosyl hydrolase [soil metagenome]